MRILILSANTGGGHNSAAASIADELSRRGIENETKDCLQFLSDRASQIISRGHFYVYRNLPKLFGKAYRFEEKHPPQMLTELMSFGAEKFHAQMQKEAYDLIICVHVFAGLLLTETRRRYGLPTPFCFVATDYTCSPGVSKIDASVWFVPDKDLKDEFTCAGIPADRIVDTGIPIGRQFYDHTIDRKTARQKLHLPQSGRIVLLCCGSMGCGHINRNAPALADKLPPDTYLVVICGHNARTYRRLKMCPNTKLVAVGYTHRIAEYMAASDICVSKPGGLTTTEIMAMGLPMVLLLAVPGCESRNMEFLTDRGLAYGTENWNEISQYLTDLFSNPDKMESMHFKQITRFSVPAAKKIVDYIEQKLVKLE